MLFVFLFYSLKAEMHKACEKVAVRIAQQTWEVGNWCAVKFLSNWERAKVLLVEDNNIKVCGFPCRVSMMFRNCLSISPVFHYFSSFPSYHSPS